MIDAITLVLLFIVLPYLMYAGRQWKTAALEIVLLTLMGLVAIWGLS